MKCTAGVRTELHDQYIAARDGKPPWSTKESVHTVHDIEHHEVVSSLTVKYKFRDKCAHQCTKQALNAFEEATELYMAEVIAKSHFYKQQLHSCRFSICQLLWQGKEGGNSYNSPTCALL